MKLRKSEEIDLATLSTWFKSQHEAIRWGGPKIRYPIEFTQLKEDLQWGTARSYSLVDGNELLGFAQLFDRFGCNHLGRVAIHPEKRGKKLGHELVSSILELKNVMHKNFSLFVYEDNPAAIKLYQNFAFEFQPYPEGLPNKKGSLFMVKKASQSLPPGLH